MWSDGCSGQFKNRWILSTLAFADDVFDVNMTWNFFAPRHGKGAVDGIGGSVKRFVYQRIMAGRVKVYSAEDFFKCWDGNTPRICSFFVATEDIERLTLCMEEKWSVVKTIKGISKLFSFIKHSEKCIEASLVGSAENSKVFKVI